MLTTTTSPEDEPSRLPARSGHGAASVIPHLHEQDPLALVDRSEPMREDAAKKPDTKHEPAERPA